MASSTTRLTACNTSEPGRDSPQRHPLLVAGVSQSGGRDPPSMTLPPKVSQATIAVSPGCARSTAARYSNGLAVRRCLGCLGAALTCLTPFGDTLARGSGQEAARCKSCHPTTPFSNRNRGPEGTRRNTRKAAGRLRRTLTFARNRTDLGPAHAARLATQEAAKYTPYVDPHHLDNHDDPSPVSRRRPEPIPTFSRHPGAGPGIGL